MSISRENLYNPYAEKIKESIEINEILDYSDVLVTIANYLTDYRAMYKITQKELAKRLGMNQTMISKLESGEYNPTLKMLLKISYALSANADYFIDILERVIEKLNNKKNYKENKMYVTKMEYEFNGMVGKSYMNNKNNIVNMERIG